MEGMHLVAVTISDVAERAGVSIATVSRVINETGYVSPELSGKVYSAMEELDYTPNIIARSLRKRKTETIGIIVPDNSNPFFAEISREIENFGFQEGYSVLLCNSDNDVKKEKAYVDVMISKLIDGVIFIASSSEKSNLDSLLNRNIPVVVVDRRIEDTEVNVILNDNELGGYLATWHLIQLGHKKIGCITGPSDVTPSFERVDGYKRALQEANLPFNDDLVKIGDFSYLSGIKAAGDLLCIKDKPTAIFACNDVMALGAIKKIHDMGLWIPSDVSIVGFDGITLSAAFTPSLTTVSQPTENIARAAVDTLLKKISGDEIINRVIIFKPILIKRESTTTVKEDS